MSDTKIKTSNIGNLAVTHALLHTDMDLTSKTVQVATPTSNTHPATKAYVDTEVANLIDSAPGTLDTLNELAAAINDDANFNATIASSIATKLPLAGGTLTGNLTLASTASGSSASPELELRRDITGADANYLGQIKFTADNDADQNVVFAKITGKILDASDGTEDGIIEFAHKKAGSNNISARFRSDSLQLINGTNLTVAGTTELTGNVGIGTSSSVTNSTLNVNGGINITTGIIGYATNDSFTLNGRTQPHYGCNFTGSSGNPSGISGYYGISFAADGAEKMRIDSSGNLLVGGTNTTPWSLSSGSGNAVIRPEGYAGFAATSAAIELNRIGSDGNIANFRKDGSVVGSIATNAGALVLKGASTSQPVQMQTHDGNEDIEVDPDGFIKMETAGTEKFRIDAGGILNVTSGGAPIIPTIKHSGIDPYLAKIRLINRSGQYIDKGGLVELGGITNDEITRTDVFASVAGLKATTASNNRTGYMQFSVNDGSTLTERMRIASDGDVTFKSAGVVTLKAAPLGSTYGAGFDVITVTGTSSAPYTSTIGFSNYSKTNAMVIQGDNVGIGTSSPGALFEVSGNTKKSRFTRSGSAGTLVEYYYGSNITAGIQVQSTGLGIGGAARENDLFIKTDGKIGIGTSNPITKLHVSDGSSATTARFDRGSSYIFDMKIDNLVSGSAIDLLWEPQQANSGHLFRTRDSGNNTVNALSITRGGDVGIGTLDPDAELHVEGTIYANNGHTVKSVTTVGTGLGEQRHRYFRHIATGVGNETFKLMRYARHWWGTGWFQIIIRGTYYGSNSKYGVFTVNGHTRNGLASVQSHINNVGTATPYADNYNSTHEACDISITLPQYEQYNIEFNILASSPQTAEANVGHHVGNSNAFFLHGTVREFI
jgi:hypothetical protein